MKKRFGSLIGSGPVLILLLFTLQQAKAQAPAADFSANTVTGCAPLTVVFKDLSTNFPKAWSWDFGNGQLSNLQNPTTTFDTPGRYTVTLVARNADGTNGITKTDFIVVNASPSVDFSANSTTGCVPVNTQFTGIASAPGGSITSWKWDFGDGSSSTDQNPQKTYDKTGFYSVSLSVVSSSGCKGNAGKPRYIRIVPGVKADFDYTPPATCKPPFNINFTNLTSGPGRVNYQWSFGDGNASTQADAVNNYTASGTYDVKLIAMSEFGCGDTIIKKAAINGTNTSIKSADTVCLNSPVAFENQSSPTANSSLWDFANGVQSDRIKDTTSYTAPGTYQVRLISSYDNCTDSAFKNIVVQDHPVVNFTADKTVSCKTGFTVNFQDNSPDAAEWSWNFGDGSPAATGKTVSHTYNTEGQFSVTLTIKTKYGCENTLTKPALINIAKPTVSIAGLPGGACENKPFTASATVKAVDGVSSYLWTMGDGATYTTQNINHQYATTNDYTVNLSITTTGGCTATATQAVSVGTPVTPSFTIPVNPVCPFTDISFTGNASPAVPGLSWTWDFGDGAAGGSGQTVTHQFTDSKTFGVTLTVVNHGCPTPSATQSITVKPPIPAIAYTIPNCNFSTTVDFSSAASKTDNTDPALSYSWNFGPNAVPSTSTSPNPTGVKFSGLGTYPVTLTITNDNCTATIEKDVILVSELAEFVVSAASVCVNTPFKLAATNSHKANIARYDWVVNGKTFTTTDSVLTTSLSAPGTYDVTLTITDLNGCTSVKTHQGIVKVTGPKANFSLTNSKGCLDNKVIFTDLSTNNGPLKWAWDFGDGTPANTSQNPTHAYADTGRYSVKLTVTDQSGCQDALILHDTVWLSQVKAAFSSNYTTICPGIDIKFKDSSSGRRLNYLWNFGDGTTSTIRNPLHRYAGTDKSYTVSLIVSDTTGCSDTASSSKYSVKAPKPSFTMKNAHGVCPLLETQFANTGKDYESVYWDFGDGGISTLDSPSHFYNSYGNYQVTMHLVGYGGCEDSVKDSVFVYNPQTTSSLSYSPLEACNSITVDFNITPTPHSSFDFNFDDGVFDTSGRTSFQHLYNSYRRFRPVLTVRDSTGCQVDVRGASEIHVIGADAFFSPDKKAFCDTGTVYFTYYHIGNDLIVSNKWDLGDGTVINSADEQDAVHRYPKPGTYPVVRTVTTQSGCSKSEYDTVRVYRTPDPTIGSDSVICINSPTTMLGLLPVPDTAIKWSWNLGNGLTSPLPNPSALYTKEGLYTINVEAANKLGCKGTDSRTVRVAPLPTIKVANNPTIAVGTGINLPVTYTPDIASYTWTPAYGLDCTDCTTPFANPKITTKYHIAVTDIYGCKAEGDVTVTVVCNDKNYFIPNTFSPNHDGMNDVFYPRGTGVTRINGMRIYNRWGDLVFERRNFNANDPSAGWDGTFKGKPANPDTYVYVIEFVCENAGIVPYQGNVTLIR